MIKRNGELGKIANRDKQVSSHRLNMLGGMGHYTGFLHILRPLLKKKTSTKSILYWYHQSDSNYS